MRRLQRFVALRALRIGLHGPIWWRWAKVHNDPRVGMVMTPARRAALDAARRSKQGGANTRDRED